MLDSNKDGLKLEAMKRIIGVIRYISCLWYKIIAEVCINRRRDSVSDDSEGKGRVGIISSRR